MSSRTHHCPKCAREWTTPDHVIQVWHRCSPPPTRRRLTYSPEEEQTKANTAWFINTFGKPETMTTTTDTPDEEE